MTLKITLTRAHVNLVCPNISDATLSIEGVGDVLITKPLPEHIVVLIESFYRIFFLDSMESANENENYLAQLALAQLDKDLAENQRELEGGENVD